MSEPSTWQFKIFRAAYHIGNRSFTSYGDTPEEAAFKLSHGLFTAHRIRPDRRDIRLTDVTEEMRLSWITGIPMSKP